MLNREARNEIEGLVRQIEKVETATEADFQEFLLMPCLSLMALIPFIACLTHFDKQSWVQENRLQILVEREIDGEASV